MYQKKDINMMLVTSTTSCFSLTATFFFNKKKRNHSPLITAKPQLKNLVFLHK